MKGNLLIAVVLFMIQIGRRWPSFLFFEVFRPDAVHSSFLLAHLCVGAMPSLRECSQLQKIIHVAGSCARTLLCGLGRRTLLAGRAAPWEGMAGQVDCYEIARRAVQNNPPPAMHTQAPEW